MIRRIFNLLCAFFLLYAHSVNPSDSLDAFIFHQAKTNRRQREHAYAKKLREKQSEQAHAKKLKEKAHKEVEALNRRAHKLQYVFDQERRSSITRRMINKSPTHKQRRAAYLVSGPELELFHAESLLSPRKEKKHEPKLRVR